MRTEFAPLFKLGRAERLQLVEDLWDSIAEEETQSPVPEGKLQELRRRKERFLRHPSSGRTWEQVKQRARAHVVALSGRRNGGPGEDGVGSAYFSLTEVDGRCAGNA